MISTPIRNRVLEHCTPPLQDAETSRQQWSRIAQTLNVLNEFLGDQNDVCVSETLPIAPCRNILQAACSSGIRLTRTVTRVKLSHKTHDGS